MRLIDADALEEVFREVIGCIAKKPEMNGNLEHMVRASAMVIEMIKDAPTIEARKTGQWVPVTERLPEEYARVIGFMAWKAMTAIEYQNGKWYSIDHLEPLPDEAVTHWMPLPEPPKDGEP